MKRHAVSMAMLSFCRPPNSAQEFQLSPYFFLALCIFFFLLLFIVIILCNVTDLSTVLLIWIPQTNTGITFSVLQASLWISMSKLFAYFCIRCWMLRASCTYWEIILNQIYNFQNVFSSTGCLFILLLVFSVHKIKKKSTNPSYSFPYCLWPWHKPKRSLLLNPVPPSFLPIFFQEFGL